ncbi:integral membrane sensor signal transduction histidine kinase [Desulfovibrio sp. X2]|uniref:two-component system sensor histidine kinase NtrB n=1 Tax=Desulfovibrio sp. X2 TaxID=941449 RepID=UPI000358DD0A|nr:ATP-binding protein [Desulfovibrio sp. X2]EPR44802.1 integral membrane sensor signal transduction histidine kinase [Desulfovibrio sp. X2]
MDITTQPATKSVTFMTVLGVVVVTASLIYMAWAGVLRQRDLLDRHLTLTAGVVARGVEAQLMHRLRPLMGRGMGQGMMGGGMMGQGMMGGGMDRHAFEPGEVPAPQNGPQAEQPGARGRGPGRGRGFGSLAGELFRETVQGSDVRYLALVGPDGRYLASFKDPASGPLPELPPKALEAMRQGRTWHGFIEADGKRVFFLLDHAAPPLAALCDSPGETSCELPAQGPGGASYLVLGLGVDEYLKIYAEDMRAAMYQTGFILCAATLFLYLANAYARRRETGHQLAVLERFNSRLLDTMPDGLLSVDAEGRVSAVNAAAGRLLAGEAQGEGAPGDGTGTADALVGRPLAEVLPAAVPGDGVLAAEAAGHRLEIIMRSLGEGQGRIVLLRDRTEALALEERLRQAEKLAAVGRMAAAVAHEVRNPLSSLRGFAQFFTKRLAGTKPDEDYAATMVREADRLNKVITDLLYLARPRAQALEAVAVRPVTEDVARLLKFDLEERGARLDLALDGQAVLGDADGLKQILLNLLLNALAALPQGEAQGGPESGNGGLVSVSAAQAEGGMVRLSVSDNGSGMDEEQRERALEPFFTTRAGGTGLGLSIVQGIVESWGGSVELDSAPGRGTTVHCLLKEAPHV